MFWFFGHEACRILAPRPGIEPAPPALEDGVSTTGLPGKSLITASFTTNVYCASTICQALFLVIWMHQQTVPSP